MKLWKESIPEFTEKAEAFDRGEINRNQFKGTSGGFGVYAQRDLGKFMLRLRMPAGEVTRNKLAFVKKTIEEEKISMLHFTTCQTIQLHNLRADQTSRIMEKALDEDIVTMGGGGDYPRNIMCSPLTGVDPKENFSVLPYARAAGNLLLDLLPEGKFPRKMKVGFSTDPENMTHASIRDIGFIAQPDGTFTVYSAGGLGNRPRLGILIKEQVAPEDAVYFVKGLRKLFNEYGDRENRSKARIRFIPEKLGSDEAYRDLLLQYAEEAKNEGGVRTAYGIGEAELPALQKRPGKLPARMYVQKQSGYYSVKWHPIGGTPDPKEFLAVADYLLNGTKYGEMRIGPDESAYLIHLSYDEAKHLLELTKTGAVSRFECSTSCVGAQICQQGVATSAGLLAECIEAVRKDGAKKDSLPKIYISGCPSSCGTHQIGEIGLRGGRKKVDGEITEVFSVSVYGEEAFGREALGREIGVMKRSDVPKFLVELKREVEARKMTYIAWALAVPGGMEQVANKYILP